VVEISRGPGRGPRATGGTFKTPPSAVGRGFSAGSNRTFGRWRGAVHHGAGQFPRPRRIAGRSKPVVRPPTGQARRFRTTPVTAGRLRAHRDKRSRGGDVTQRHPSTRDPSAALGPGARGRFPRDRISGRRSPRGRIGTQKKPQSSGGQPHVRLLTGNHPGRAPGEGGPARWGKLAGMGDGVRPTPGDMERKTPKKTHPPPEAPRVPGSNPLPGPPLNELREPGWATGAGPGKGPKWARGRHGQSGGDPP